MSSIKQKYFNPRLSGSFSGLNSFYKNRKITLPIKDVKKELLKLQEYYSLFPNRKRFKRRKIISHFNSFMFCSDLIILPQKYLKENKPYRYICLFIDQFSRMMYAYPIANKRPAEIIGALKKLLKAIPKPLSYLHTDQGNLCISV